MKIAVHDFKHLVCSDGEIVGFTNCLLDVNTAGTNGMSGGPIFSQEIKVIGAM